jgi:hypothetical protein
MVSRLERSSDGSVERRLYLRSCLDTIMGKVPAAFLDASDKNPMSRSKPSAASGDAGEVRCPTSACTRE